MITESVAQHLRDLRNTTHGNSPPRQQTVGEMVVRSAERSQLERMEIAAAACANRAVENEERALAAEAALADANHALEDLAQRLAVEEQEHERASALGCNAPHVPRWQRCAGESRTASLESPARSDQGRGQQGARGARAAAAQLGSRACRGACERRR